MKKIKIVINAEVELPDKAEVIRFTDEEGITTDHIKFMGRLFRPDVDWLQYFTSDLLVKKYGKKHGRGHGYESIDDELANGHFLWTSATWYLEEE